jgi:hypothetical protein
MFHLLESALPEFDHSLAIYIFPTSEKQSQLKMD